MPEVWWSNNSRTAIQNLCSHSSETAWTADCNSDVPCHSILATPVPSQFPVLAPVLAVETNWGVNHQIEDLCFSPFLSFFCLSSFKQKNFSVTSEASYAHNMVWKGSLNSRHHSLSTLRTFKIQGTSVKEGRFKASAYHGGHSTMA